MKPDYKYYFNLLFIATLLIFLALATNFSQENTTGEPIVLKYADSLLGNKINEGNIRRFIGHVRFEQNDVHVTSDTAVQFLDENRAVLNGYVVVTQEDMILKSPQINWNGNTYLAESHSGVVITDKNQKLTANNGVYSTKTMIADFRDSVVASDDTVTIKCNRIIYNRKTRNSYAYGNVRVEDDSTIILTDFGEYHRETRESYAYGNVLIKGKYNNSYLSGDTILNFPERLYTLARGNPILNQIDTIKKTKKVFALADSFKLAETDSSYFEFDTLSVTADTMEEYRTEDDIFFFRENVKIAKKRISAIAENAIYYKKRGLIILMGKPIVWYDSTQLHGDSIIIDIPNKKLSEIHSYGNSLAATRADTMDIERINQIIGNEISLKFSQDTIRSLWSYGSAKSLYFLQNAKGEDGIDRKSCDTIFIEFKNNEVVNINWYGGIQGELYPEVMIISPKEYYLPNFIWCKNRPVLQLSKFLKNLEK